MEHKSGTALRNLMDSSFPAAAALDNIKNQGVERMSFLQEDPSAINPYSSPMLLKWEHKMCDLRIIQNDQEVIRPQEDRQSFFHPPRCIQAYSPPTCMLFNSYTAMHSATHFLVMSILLSFFGSSIDGLLLLLLSCLLLCPEPCFFLHDSRVQRIMVPALLSYASTHKYFLWRCMKFSQKCLNIYFWDF